VQDGGETKALHGWDALGEDGSDQSPICALSIEATPTSGKRTGPKQRRYCLLIDAYPSRWIRGTNCLIPAEPGYASASSITSPATPVSADFIPSGISQLFVLQTH